MYVVRSLLFLALVYGLANSAMSAGAGAGEAEFIWDNSKGLLSAKNCKVETRTSVAFKIANDPSGDLSAGLEFLHDSKPCAGETNKNKLCPTRPVPIRSLVRADESRKKFDGFQYTKVVGLHSAPGSQVLPEMAWRGFDGFMLKEALSEINAYGIQLTDDFNIDHVNGESVVLGKIPGTTIPVEGGILTSAREGTKYVVFKCGGKDYPAFDFRIASQAGPIARIGVMPNESAIFRNIRVYTLTEADGVLGGQLSQNEVVSAPVADVVVPVPAVRPDNVEIATTSAQDTPDVDTGAEGADEDNRTTAVEGDFKNVACMGKKDEVMSVYDDNQEKVLFTVANGTPLKFFQDFNGGQPKEVFRNGVTNFFVRIQITETGASGWALQENVQQASGCASLESAAPASGNDTAGTTDNLKVGIYAVCTADSDGQLSVYNEEFKLLERRYFLDNGEKVTVIDGTLVDKPEPNGNKYVKVTTESNYTRYVAKDFLTQGTCASSADQDVEAAGGNVSGDYIFPVTTKTGFSYIKKSNRPSQDSVLAGFTGYNNNYGVYGASRSKGKRGHAATDLYQRFGLKRPNSDYSRKFFGGAFRAITNGKVVRGSSFFYLSTYYVVVKHDDGVVSRYGEVYQGVLVKKGDRVKTGDKMGYVKWVGIGAVPPMLHFENYNCPKDGNVGSGVLGGNKVVNGRNTQRSKCLFDRTSFMLDLENKTF